MNVKIKRATVPHSESLCDTCMHAHRLTGFRETEELVICNFTYPAHRVPFRVSTCTDYNAKSHTTLADMKKIAWTVSGDAAKHRPGFVATGSFDPLSPPREEEDQFIPWE